MKIDKLTPSQEAQIKVYYDEWYKWGTCTDAADRPRAERAVISMLESVGQYNNQRIVWCNGPLTAEALINVLSNKDFRASLGDSLRASLGDSLRDSLIDSLIDSLRDSLRASLIDSLGDSLRASLGDSLRASLIDSLGDSQLNYHGTWFDGHIDSYWVCFYKFCRDVVGVKYDSRRSSQLDMHIDLCRSAGRVYFYQNMVIICERPEEIHFSGRSLHRDGGPAVKYRDGFCIWALNGVRVPQYLAETPEGQMDIEFFKKEQNADVRTEFVRKYGVARMLSLGRKIDDHTNYSDEWWSASEYELWDMAALYPGIRYAPHLKMRNQTTGVMHVEAVSPACRTLPDAIKERLGGRDLRITNIK